MEVADVLTLAALAALAAKLVSAVKYLLAGEVGQFATQAVVWVVGALVVMVAAQADIAAGIVIGDTPLAALDVWSQILVGLQLSSSAAFAYDFKKALDNTDSSSEPALFGSVSSGGRANHPPG